MSLLWSLATAGISSLSQCKHFFSSRVALLSSLTNLIYVLQFSVSHPVINHANKLFFENWIGSLLTAACRHLFSSKVALLNSLTNIIYALQFLVSNAVINKAKKYCIQWRQSLFSEYFWLEDSKLLIIQIEKRNHGKPNLATRTVQALMPNPPPHSLTPKIYTYKHIICHLPVSLRRMRTPQLFCTSLHSPAISC